MADGTIADLEKQLRSLQTQLSDVQGRLTAASGK